ncbi:hypothetical protein FRC98_16255 [Lujinxingia vulgaris]|uniref:Uncharacterized protein n=1 Tax=Lujinxingia vulgaris TaxID=2600176 RepID=A0A5C6XD89_9DELT|nr:hypothetical protein [Lujinxingia vulgaris]TXD35367.1 hypothetical protein FRC98_16255 [Lujinxingia vulgaris]
MRNVSKTMGFALLAAAIVTIGSPGDASAQQAIFEFDEIVVEGRIQKPEAFYIIQAANLSYEPVDPKPTFLPELLESVEEEPF